MLTKPEYNLFNSVELLPLTRIVLLCATLLLTCFVLLFTSTQAFAEIIDASIFLGPPLGETLVLGRDDGTVIKRTTTAISEAGVYFIEDRTKLPVKKLKEGIYSGKRARIMSGEEDIVDNYKLQAVNGKVLLTRADDTEVMVDLVNRKWTQRGDNLSGKYFEIKCRIVDEKEELILGKRRKVIQVETVSSNNGNPVKSVYKIASGLGMIHYEVVAPGDPLVLFTLKYN